MIPDKRLLEAARNGDIDKVKIALAAGADVNIKDKYGWTALMFAARKGYEGIIRLLLNAGIDVDTKNNTGSRTALMWATDAGNEAVVRILLNAGADIEAKDRWNWVAFMFAVVNNHEKIVQILLAAGANVKVEDNRGDTLLHHYARSIAVAELLIDAGADMEARDRDGYTPAEMQRICGNHEVADYIDDRLAARKTEEWKRGAEPMTLFDIPGGL